MGSATYISTLNTRMAGGDGKDKKGVEVQSEFKFATKPEEKTGWEGFSQFVWNSETSEFLGRTGMSWLKIGVFYIIYYALLAGFFMGMLLIFYETLDKKEPRWQNSNGIIGSNPGVGFRPMPNQTTDIQSTLIWFREGDDNGNWKQWVNRLDTFLAPYTNASYLEDRVDCNLNMTSHTQQCNIDIPAIVEDTNCTKKNNYGYRDGNPCIVLKLNKIYNWEPKPFDKMELLYPKENAKYEVKKAVEKMPPSLKKKLEKNINESNPWMNNKVYIDCKGENPADVENLGEIVYYPENAFPFQYFPYQNQDAYLSPIVFVYLKKPNKGVLISIECKAWAANIVHDRMERRGLAHFEVMID